MDLPIFIKYDKAGPIKPDWSNLSSKDPNTNTSNKGTGMDTGDENEITKRLNSKTLITHFKNIELICIIHADSIQCWEEVYTPTRIKDYIEEEW